MAVVAAVRAAVAAAGVANTTCLGVAERAAVAAAGAATAAYLAAGAAAAETSIS